MLRLLLLLSLPASSVLAYPAPYWPDQLISQPPDGRFMENAVAPPPASAVNLVYQFKNLTKLENLAARSNGHLLLSAVSEPYVYYLEPEARRPSARLLHQFPNATGMTGIVETTPDVFVVIAGNWSTKTFKSTPGSFSAWSIDFNTKRKEPDVKFITALPAAAALNGLTTLDGSPDTVLISDSGPGAIWKLNIVTGDHSIAIENQLFANTTRSPLGINGIASFGNKLHFLNSAQRIYGRIPINGDGSAAGMVEVLQIAGKEVFSYDDLAMDWEGNAWIATHTDALTEITVEGKSRNITADEKGVEMTQPTSVVFGRGSKKQEKTVYIVTSGNQTTGGQVFAVDTCLI